MAKGTFWDDRKKAEVIVRQSRDLKDLLDPWEKIDRQLKELNCQCSAPELLLGVNGGLQLLNVECLQCEQVCDSSRCQCQD